MMTLEKMKDALGTVSIPEPAADDPIVLDESANLNLIAWGDPQISFISPLRSARITGACRDLENMKGKADALLLLGDICEYGKRVEFEMAADIFGSVSDKFSNLIAVSGNHDIRVRHYHSQLERFNSFLKSVPGGVPGNDKRYFFTHEINSYKFIMMGADRSSFESSYIGRRQLEKLDKEIAACGGKPVFVLNHQTLKRMNGLPTTWLGKGQWRGSVGKQSDEIKAIFEKYKNVFFITGHLHYGVSKYNYEDYGAFKAISLPTIGVINHGKNSTDGQGYIISVYDDKVVLRARYFADGKYMGADIENSYVEIPLD